MFETLLSKTLFILAISLGFCFLGALGVVKFFQQAFKKGASYVTAKTNEHGQLDLEVSPTLIVKIFWPSLILNIITFIILLFCKEKRQLSLSAAVSFCRMIMYRAVHCEYFSLS